MKSSRSEKFLFKDYTNSKCKIENCSRARRMRVHCSSNFCKVHEAFIFLVKLKYSLKKLFGNLRSGLAALQRETGEFFVLKDICNFMNFVMIPFLLEDVQNLFEVLGSVHKNKNISIIYIEDIRRTMKSKECGEVIEVEIRIIIEVVSSCVKTNGMKNVITILDPDCDGLFDIDDFVRTFRIRETQAYLFFQKVFQCETVPLSGLTSLFPNNRELCVTLSEINAEKLASPFFPVKNGGFLSKFESIAAENPIFDVNAEKCSVSSLRNRLLEVFPSCIEAFKALSNPNNEIRYFQMLRTLSYLNLDCSEEICREIIKKISNSNRISFDDFKEFWYQKKNICKIDNCARDSVENQNFCEFHLSAKKNDGFRLLEKLKSQTSLWKSPRKVLNFYTQLEADMAKNKFVQVKKQLNTVLPMYELPKNKIVNLRSILGKLN